MATFDIYVGGKRVSRVSGVETLKAARELFNWTPLGMAARGSTVRVKKARAKKNPAAATFYRFSGGGGTYQNIHVARPAAQAHADATGQSVAIQSAKGGNTWKHYGTVKPKAQKNPPTRMIRLSKEQDDYFTRVFMAKMQAHKEAQAAKRKARKARKASTGSSRIGAEFNPAKIRAKKIEIVRNARGQAVKLRIHRA